MKKLHKLIAGFIGILLISAPIPVASQNIINGTWSTQADEYSANVGKQYTFYFPPGGTLSSRIWGTDIYTYDCSIATAAVHAGLITTQKGGTVTIEIRPGESAYKGSTRNGVTSNSYGAFGGSYGGSFIFVNTGVIPERPVSADILGTWSTQAYDYIKNIGQRYSFYFPPGSTEGKRVWGTDVYTYDCSIATAAVHAGLITPQQGGKVTIEMRPGQSSYTGSTRNGVTSNNYGAFGGSFIFVNPDGTPVVSVPAAIRGTWSTQADEYSANVGKQYTFYFPPGGTLSSRIWGTDIYTYDCSIATAAVHAGLITTQQGGTVTIEIRPGESSYKGSTRNGVTSNSYGAFGGSNGGSFVFVNTGVLPDRPVLTVIQGNWSTQANEYSANIGKRYSFYFPPGGVLSGRVWGTDIYTYDCSIASAAVHAGLITTQKGGTVTIEIRRGQSSYRGSTRNGVSSRNYGAFGGSFVFIR